MCWGWGRGRGWCSSVRPSLRVTGDTPLNLGSVPTSTPSYTVLSSYIGTVGRGRGRRRRTSGRGQ